MHTFWKKSISVFLFAMLLLQLSLPTFALTKETGSSVPGTEFVNSTATAASTSSVAAPQKHEPVPGVVDGAVYYLRNAANGTYMDVDNGGTASGTNISTYLFHGGLNQQFRFRYLGKEIYELIPMHSQNTRVKAADASGGTNMVIASESSLNTRFKITRMSDETFSICSVGHNYTNAIGFDVNHPNNVIEQNYGSYTSGEYAQWYLEAVDPGIYDAYEKYFIRNVGTGLYLDVMAGNSADGTVVHARTLIGTENTQFRKIYHAEEDAFQFAPIHNTDSRLTLPASGNLQIGSASSENQFFRAEAVGTDALGRTTYRFRTASSGYTQYLNIGTVYEETGHGYPENGSNADDLWVLEPVYYDSPTVRRAETNQTDDTVVYWNGYQTILTYQSTRLSRYKIEITKQMLYPFSISIYDGTTGTEPAYWTLCDEHADYAYYDVCFEAGHVYYIVVESQCAQDIPFFARIRQFTASFHSNNQDGKNPIQADLGIENICSYADAMNWFVTKRLGITANEARNATNSLTGYSDFASEIFVYSGHGTNGLISYEGNQDTLYRSGELPLMPYCELAVFASCYSASNATNGAYSMAEQSIRNGARTAIGWSAKIGDNSCNTYLARFMEYLTYGYSVEVASNKAISRASFSQANTIVSSLEIKGNKANILFPCSASGLTANSADLTMSNRKMQNVAFAASEYTLVSFNKECGIKLYTRMINGIPSDDYYMEFYDESGNLTDIQKSENTMDAQTIYALSAADVTKWEQTFNAAETDLVYTCTNGVWQLSRVN